MINMWFARRYKKRSSLRSTAMTNPLLKPIATSESGQRSSIFKIKGTLLSDARSHALNADSKVGIVTTITSVDAKNPLSNADTANVSMFSSRDHELAV